MVDWAIHPCWARGDMSEMPVSSGGGGGGCPALPPMEEGDGLSDGDTDVLEGGAGGDDEFVPFRMREANVRVAKPPRSSSSRAGGSRKPGPDMGAAEAERIGLVRKIEVARVRVDELDKQLYDLKEAVRKLSDALGSHWVGTKKIGRAKASGRT